MEKNVCFLCDGEFVFEKWYGKCDHCKILRPESEERMLEEIDSILSLQKRIGNHLHNLEQKYISTPNEMTSQEAKERTLWIEHIDLYGKIMFFMEPSKSNNNISKETKFEKLYPLLYSYVELVDKIKEIYP